MRLAVYDIGGRQVAVLIDAILPSGHHIASWNGRSDDGVELAPGVYLIRLETPDGVRHRKAVMTR